MDFPMPFPMLPYPPLAFDWSRLLRNIHASDVGQNNIMNLRKSCEIPPNKTYVLCNSSKNLNNYWPAEVKRVIRSTLNEEKEEDVNKSQKKSRRGKNKESEQEEDDNDEKLELKWWDCSCYDKSKCQFIVKRCSTDLANMQKFVTFNRPCPWRPNSQMIDSFMQQNPPCFFATRLRRNDHVKLVMMDTHDLSPNMLIECVHPKTRTSCHAAVVEEVINPHEAIIRIDSNTRFRWQCSELTVMPVGTCLKMGVYLHPPEDHVESDYYSFETTTGTIAADRAACPPESVFSWRQYLQRTKDKKACFTLPRIDMREAEARYKVGSKLEVKVPDSDDLHCGTILKVSHGLLFIHIDSWTRDKPCLILPIDTKDIFPTGWAKDHGLNLVPPLGFTMNFSGLGDEDLPPLVIDTKCHVGPFLNLKKVKLLQRQTPPARRHLLWQSFLSGLLRASQSQVAHQNLRSRLEMVNNETLAGLNTPFMKIPKRCESLLVSIVYDKCECLKTVVPIKREYVDQYLLRLCTEVFEACPHFLRVGEPEYDMTAEQLRAKRLEEENRVCPNKCYFSYKYGKLRKFLDKDITYFTRLGKLRFYGSSSNRSSKTSSSNSEENIPPVHCMTTRHGKRNAANNEKPAVPVKQARLNNNSAVAADRGASSSKFLVDEDGKPITFKQWRLTAKHDHRCKLKTSANGDDSVDRSVIAAEICNSSEEPTNGDRSSEEGVDFHRRVKRGIMNIDIPPFLSPDTRQWSISDVATFANRNDGGKIEYLITDEQIDGKTALLLDSQTVKTGLKDGCPRCILNKFYEVLIKIRAIYHKRLPYQNPSVDNRSFL